MINKIILSLLILLIGYYNMYYNSINILNNKFIEINNKKYKYKKDTISNNLLRLTTIFILIIMIYYKIGKQYIICMLITNSIVYLLKSCFNIKRPDFNNRCCIGRKKNKDKIINKGHIKDVCCLNLLNNNEKQILLDGFNSFPSGHTSNAFTMLFFILLIYNKNNFNIIYTTIIILFLLYIPISRTKLIDNKHRVIDLVCGFIISLICFIKSI